MESQIAFNATKCSMSFLGAFFAEVARELGEDKAVEMYARQGIAWGGTVAQIIKSHAGQSDASQQIRNELAELYESFGVTTEFEKEDGKLIVNAYQCPIYEGLLEAGLEQETIHKMCQAFADQEAARMKEILPESASRLTEFRTSAEGCCREEITLGI